MSNPELPQPIYPTGPGGAPPPGPPGPPMGGPPMGGPPMGGPPMGGPPMGGPPMGGPPTGGGPAKPSGPFGNQTTMIVVLIVAVAVVAGIVYFATKGDDSESAGNGNGSNQSSDEPGTDEPNGGGDRDEAEAAAQLQVINPASGTVECLTDALVDDAEVLDQIKDDPEGVSIDDPDAARRYAEMVGNCASTDEISETFLTAFQSQGLGEFELGCLETEFSNWGTSEWVDVIELSAQPDRASEVQAGFQEIISFC